VYGVAPKVMVAMIQAVESLEGRYQNPQACRDSRLSAHAIQLPVSRSAALSPSSDLSLRLEDRNRIDFQEQTRI
jgi:hypothetical protein